MSEPVLKAIIHLFALVATEDQVTKQERERIEEFLADHLSQKAVPEHLRMFDAYTASMVSVSTREQEEQTVRKIAVDINQEFALKQKTVIMLELMSIILADGNISDRENRLALTIANSFKISDADVQQIKKYVSGQRPEDFDHPDILVIDSQQSVAGKTKHIYRGALDGCIAICYIRSADIYFFKYLGKTDVFLNGVPQKPGNVNVLAAGSALRWEATDPVYYGDILSQFKKITGNTRFSFEAKDISFQFKSGRLGLRDVNIHEEGGKLIALMGASGAGKSTLLHVLNGTEKPSSGKVLINGIDIHKDPENIEGIIGFVPQDDLLMEDLTVYQNLYFAARLCFSHLSEEEIDLLVMKNLDDLGLSETKDLTVGSPLRKTISGGQRKRLNIGLELLREPAVLFVDEPTSGLSSRDSENIIDLLKELSLKGKLVFAVIHQPSSDIFKMFDKLVILDTGGYQIYYGNPVDAITYFKRGINMVNSDQGECQACGNVNPEQIFNIIETKVINEFGNFTNERKFSPEQWNKNYLDNVHLKGVVSSTDVPASSLRIPNWLEQTQLFFQRDLLSKFSNKQYLVINVLEGPLLAFILAFIVRYHSTEDPMRSTYVFSKNLNMPAHLFMSVIVALFMGLTVSAEEIIRDRKILKREAFLHLSRSSYIFSKISMMFMISAIQTLLFVLVANSILEIRDMFFEHWAILFTTSCFANLLGLNISSAFNSAVTIYILIPILLIPQLILSGVVVKFDKLNPVIGNAATVPFVGDMMTSRWAFEAAMVTQFKDNQFEAEFYPYDKTMANSDFQKIYFIPEIETKLDFINLNFNNPEPEIRAQVVKDLALVRYELLEEVREVGTSGYEILGDLTPEKFNPEVLRQSRNFIEILKQYYINVYNKADKIKDKIITHRTRSADGEREFEDYKERYQNEAIAALVKNVEETHRILEKDGKLVQKIYPIYKEPTPEHYVDFDAQFYSPQKHFLNRNIDTFWFNLSVIWFITIIFSIALYYEWLRKMIEGLGNLSSPVPKRM